MNEKLDNKTINEIRNELQEQQHNLQGFQFRNCNAYIGFKLKVTIGNNDYYVRPIISYKTVVGFADIDNLKYYEIGKYSRTTSKQVTQIYNEYFTDYERLFENSKEVK